MLITPMNIPAGGSSSSEGAPSDEVEAEGGKAGASEQYERQGSMYLSGLRMCIKSSVNASAKSAKRRSTRS
jgi:hypothetical protein